MEVRQRRKKLSTWVVGDSVVVRTEGRDTKGFSFGVEAGLRNSWNIFDSKNIWRLSCWELQNECLWLGSFLVKTRFIRATNMLKNNNYKKKKKKEISCLLYYCTFFISILKGFSQVYSKRNIRFFGNKTSLHQLRQRFLTTIDDEEFLTEFIIE